MEPRQAWVSAVYNNNKSLEWSKLSLSRKVARLITVYKNMMDLTHKIIDRQV